MIHIDVKIIRKNLGLTQEKFAELIGVSKNTVLNYEKGKKIPQSKIAILNSVIKNHEKNQVKEPQKNYGIPKELSGDVVEDLRQQIYNLKDIIKDKEEIIALLKEKIKEHKCAPCD